MLRRSKSFLKMWGQEIAKHGFVRIPKVLLEQREDLGLNAERMVLLVYLRQKMSEGKTVVSISQAELVRALGIPRRTLRGHIEYLENLNYLSVIKDEGNEPHQYSLKGFRDRLDEIEKKMKEDNDMWL